MGICNASELPGIDQSSQPSMQCNTGCKAPRRTVYMQYPPGNTPVGPAQRVLGRPGGSVRVVDGAVYTMQLR